MPCFHPLEAWRGPAGPSGRLSVVFDRSRSLGIPITLPCGRCIGCRLEKSRQWAVRMMHEASLHEDNCFLTLTYDPEHMPPDGSLCVWHFQDFMKRLRFRFRDRKIRFFHCGEYGESFARPHYHACVFGFDFPDKRLLSGVDDRKLFSSSILDNLWGRGFCSVGSLSFESAAYVASYVTKKVTGDAAAGHYQLLHPVTGELTPVLPEYVTMSRRPGIAADWLKKFGSEVLFSDEVIARGHPAKPPRYYDKYFEANHGVEFEAVKGARVRAQRERSADSTPERLAVREVCAKARVGARRRTLERG